MPTPAGLDTMPGIIVPRKTVGELQKLLEGVDDDVRVEVSDNKIRVAIGNVVLTSKLIDGTFPDYVRVIPQGNDKLMKVDRSDFAGRCRPGIDPLPANAAGQLSWLSATGS